MVHNSASDQKTVLLPPGLFEAFKLRLVEAGGLLIMGVNAWLMLSLLSWNSGDPSWNNAGATTVANLGGLWGAHMADLLMQTLGIVSLFVPASFAAWGFQVMRQHEVPGLWKRVSLLPFALTTAGAFAATLTVPGFWPIAASLGGTIGDLAFKGLNGAFLSVGLVAPLWAMSIALFIISAALLYLAIGIRVQDVSRAIEAMREMIARTNQFLRRPASWISEAKGFVSRVRLPEKKEPSVERIEPVMDGDGIDEFDHAPVVQVSPQRKRVERTTKKAKQSRRAKAENQPQLDIEPSEDYALPALDLLDEPNAATRVIKVSDDALEQNARLLESVLNDFGVKGEILQVRPGPVVTLYELEPAPGIKSSRVIGLADDIARSMSAVSARVAVIPGRNVIGIELPNAQRETVSLKQLLSTADYDGSGAQLALGLGKDIGGSPVVVDLARMPHLLIAGTTGSGKSVALNTMILSLLYRMSPDQCRMIMIDPKMLELSVYDDIPHLLSPVVTDPGKAVVALKWTVREMEDRYKRMAQLGVRNLAG